MIRLVRDFRIVPIALVAITCLFALKSFGKRTDFTAEEANPSEPVAFHVATTNVPPTRTTIGAYTQKATRRRMYRTPKSTATPANNATIPARR